MFDLAAILEGLRAHRNKIDEAIRALEELSMAKDTQGSASRQRRAAREPKAGSFEPLKAADVTTFEES